MKPTVARVKELFGSWDSAWRRLGCSRCPCRVSGPCPRSPAEPEFTSSDPARYRELAGPLPEVLLDAGRAGRILREITSLIGSGYLALAEAA